MPPTKIWGQKTFLRWLVIVSVPLFLALLFSNMALNAIFTGELPSKGSPVYRDLSPKFFPIGIALYFGLSALAGIFGIIKLIKSI